MCRNYQVIDNDHSSQDLRHPENVDKYRELELFELFLPNVFIYW